MSFYEAQKYIAYKLKARNEHSIHSPFVFKLYTEVIRNKENYYAFDEIRTIRKKLLRNTEMIDVTDLGAGSKTLKTARSIAQIAKVSVIREKYGELLFRLVNYFQPKNILELGTSLGLSAFYMHKAAPKAKLTTVEGCADTHKFAVSLLKETGTFLVNDSFDNFLSKSIEQQKFDFIYIDGNHTYEATINYFKILLDHIDNDSVMIFDDIYWSPGMTKAWEEIKKNSSVTISIDLYKFGLVFFRKENKQKEDFCLRY
jgi:predicted O-methyltransferase YrrM